MSAELILQEYEEGHSALLVTGRSPFDLVVDGSTGGAVPNLRPMIERLRAECQRRHGMVLVTYSLADGLDWDSSIIADEGDRQKVQGVLRAHHLNDVAQDDNEIARVLRGISSLARQPTNSQWKNGNPIRFCFFLEFGEHLTPGSLTNGTQTDPQLVAVELAHLTGNSLALRSSGNLVVFHAREGMVDSLVSDALHPVRLRHPDRQEKGAFLDAALAIYTKAAFEASLSRDAAANLTSNTPNRGLESLLRASHRSGRPIQAAELAAQKARDVEVMSEHTLSVLDTRRVANLELHGATIDVPAKALASFGAALMRGDSAMPANVLLVGPPGSGKTDLAILTAKAAGVTAYQQHSPKGGIVGETERKARLQQDILLEWSPNISFCDEITEALPLERSDFDGDSGASRAVTAALLTALSNEERRGRSLLIATTNCPWRMGAAMRGRFVVIPVLAPIATDYPGILLAIARRISPGLALTFTDVAVAAGVFCEKGASPRHIRTALSNALLIMGTPLTPEAIAFAAEDLTVTNDQGATILADLWAVKACTSKSFLPWSASPKGFPVPEHFSGIVDPNTGTVNSAALDKRIKELENAGHANL